MMPDPHSATMLLAVLCLLQLLFAGAWLVAGLRLNVAREASLHWSVLCLAIAVTTGAFLFADAHAHGVVVALRSTGMIVGLLALRRGLQVFLNLPRRDLDAWLVLAVHAGVLIVMGVDEEARRPRALVQTVLVAWVLLSAALPQGRALAKEFGTAAAVLCSGTLAVAAIGFGSRALTFALGFHVSEVNAPTNLNVVFVALLVVLAVGFNFMFGYFVVARLVRALQWQSLHDELTGLRNRRSFDQLLAHERQRSLRTRQSLAVLIVDIDHFKSVNDSVGHAAGDAVLRRVAETMTACSRQTDTLGRIGGEEFALLLPETDLEGARQHAQRIREAIMALVVPWESHALQVTVSVGVATCEAIAGSNDDPVLAADRALYRAKANGRNRVEVEPADR